MLELIHKYLLRMMDQLHYTISVVHAGMGGKANFQPVIRTRVISPNINGDGNLVLTELVLDLEHT